MRKKKCYIISNRLPFSYDKYTDKLIAGSGGLVTALGGVDINYDLVWAGSVSDSHSKSKIEKLNKLQKKEKFKYLPINIPEKLYSSYYNSFCNDVLWPLLHYQSDLVKFSSVHWESYLKVNIIFAEKLLKVLQKGDIVWIHDFHFFMLPELLRMDKKNIKIGFFLHIPFPSSEIFKQLPVREQILNSLLKSDLVGFHDIAYLRHFSVSISSILGISSELLSIEHNGHIANLGVFPVSIDTHAFKEKSKLKTTNTYYKKFINAKGNLKVILGIDRLDYIKGLPLKLKMFRTFLRKNTKYIGRLQLIQVAIPTRQDVQEYVKLKEEVELLIGQINGEFSTAVYTPIKYIYKSLNMNELLALYQSSDMLYISSKRDGMNLVCLEYLTAQKSSNPGVVILSEFAGASSTLSHALQVNPWDYQDISDSIIKALEMSLTEKIERHSTMLKFLDSYTASDWALSFLTALEKNTKEVAYKKVINLNVSSAKRKLVRSISGKNITLVLDYDGTLVPIAKKPAQAVIDTKNKKLIKKISKKYGIDLIILSGRDSKFLLEQFKDIEKVSLASEHGSKFLHHSSQRWKNLTNSKSHLWYNQALETFDTFTKRTPGSFIEKKENSIAWHYRLAPLEFGIFQSRKLLIELEEGLSNSPVTVIEGKKIVEVKANEANKGNFINWYKSTNYYLENSIIIGVGDDLTDEDMFSIINDNGVSIKIGNGFTHANYRLNNQSDLIEFLNSNILNIT
ncbi:MAG: bifunctional alpha,alpha-trehalose-phosphate synthase (UDP-forming)/trehalose-phosphatase [Bdellovibrionales bacterium]|jgi:trehalose 6-phosphate synthase/phosphatase|nr:bifunctional alpha,alpha-trehalose-phosphate synthase (UDP-forming)/trehalose-phosphatase [Bdellovibrionales bacterium]